MNGSLAGFEERRLAELKEHVAARAAAERAGRPHAAAERAGWPRRRMVLAVAAGAAIAAVASVVTVSSMGGADRAYAVTKDSDGIVYVTVRDFRDAAGLTRQLKSLNVPAIVDFVPAGQKCKEPRAEPVTDIPRGLYYAPRNIPGDDAGSGWQMQINTKLFKPGQTFVWTLAVDPVYGGSDTSTILMRDPVAPCELVPDDVQHVVPKMPFPEVTSLGGYRVEGKTVGEVLPEIEKRGLKVTYLITEPPPERYPGDPYLMYPTKQGTPVGADWFVWQADEPEKGVIRLMVTQKLQKP
ncbi:hypothetical protein AB0L53_25705 [Nonomuraea sp. NPDC052129]|uniref:hypothetical protein n=1 Tax=Nonomuraea sp. NPDC052129 TaxID=3154651 RepID=UPI003425F0E6